MWNGSTWTQPIFWRLGFRSYINSMWLSDDHHVRVFVGSAGNLMYHRDGKYIKHPNAPEEDFRDVDGFADGRVVIAGGHRNFGLGSLHTMTPDGRIDPLWRRGRGIVERVKIWDETVYFITRRNLYRLDGLTEQTLFTSDLSLYEFEGNSPNDLFILSLSNVLYHYNGSTFEEIGPSYPKYLFSLGMSVKDDVVCFVAYTPEQYCLVFTGRRVA